MDKKVSDILYGIPNNVDYTEVAEDLDAEDVSESRIEDVKQLLKNSDKYIVFQAAKLLTSWGIDDGFNVLTRLFRDHQLSGMIIHRLHGYDDTLQHVLNALISYWATKSDLGSQQREEARKNIYPYVAEIINLSSHSPFEINGLFWMVVKYNYTEYFPLLKKYLEVIIDRPEIYGWKIHDVMEVLLKIDPNFVNELLLKKGKTLQDFNF